VAGFAGWLQLRRAVRQPEGGAPDAKGEPSGSGGIQGWIWANSTHRDMGDDERQGPQREPPSPPPDEPELHGHCMPCLAGAATAPLPLAMTRTAGRSEVRGSS
jgi:hypothetical protein